MPQIFLPQADIQTQQNPQVDLSIVGMPSYSNNASVLFYNGNGGDFFDTLPSDVIEEGGLWHGGNPLLTQQFSIKSCSNLSITSEKVFTYSQTKDIGLFSIENNKYYWNNVYTSVLGVYTASGSATGFQFQLDGENLHLFTNDVNTIPRVGDFIVLNEYQQGYFSTGETTMINSINNKIDRLPYFQGKSCLVCKINEVIIESGTGANIKYNLLIDKTFNIVNGRKYGVVLLNRMNTSIQKDLFYSTFEFLEIHRQQLLGDPYNNVNNINVPVGRYNYLNYNNNKALGYPNLLSHLIPQVQKTPVVILEINDEIKDRFSDKLNSYSQTYSDIHFELHLPGIILSECSDLGTYENILIAQNFSQDDYIGLISEIYLKSDLTRRIGWLLNDLRIICLDDSELVTALGYNSNRNFVLPAPQLQPGKFNELANRGAGIDLTIINVVYNNLAPGGPTYIITTDTPHNLQRGTQIYIEGVESINAVNGTWFIDTTPQLNELALYSVAPIYNNSGILIQPGTGIPNATITFIQDSVNPGKIYGALPPYNYFYTYRIKTKENNSVLPYSKISDFNFTLNGQISSEDAACLYTYIPRIPTMDQVGNNAINHVGFNSYTVTDGYGIEIIIGKYSVDTINPSVITGVTDIVSIPLTDLSTFTSTSQIIDDGLNIQVSLYDYNQALANDSYKYDIYNNFKLYDNIIYPMGEDLNTAFGRWLIGNVKAKNQIEVNRVTFDIIVPAENWNATTNPTFVQASNIEKNSKYITEVALMLEGNDTETHPMIYTKIGPPVKKTADLDLNITLKVDF